jgi:indoleacetamide hydrolase
LRPTSFGVGSAAASPYRAQGVVPLALDLDMIGPIGRTVEDVILLDEVIQRRPVPRVADIQGRRLGNAREQWHGLDPEVERICQAALQQLQSAGAQLVDVTGLKDIDAEAMELFGTLITAGNQHDLKVFLAENVPGLSMQELLAGVRSADVHYWFEKAAHAHLPSGELNAARHERRMALIARYGQLISGNRLDAMVCPTEPVVAPLIRPAGDRFDDTLSIAGEVMSAPLAYVRNTAPTCVLGVPALSLPAGLSGAGLPVALQFVGLPGADAPLLGLAAAVQSILGPIPAAPVPTNDGWS